MPGEDVFCADALARRAKQKEEKVPAMNRILRPLVTRGKPARFRPDHLPVLVVATPFLRGHAGGGKRLAQAHFIQLTHCVGLKIDPGAQRTQFPDRFEYFCLNACLMQAQRHRQTSDAAPYDDCFHGSFLRVFVVIRRDGQPLECIRSMAPRCRVDMRRSVTALNGTSLPLPGNPRGCRRHSAWISPTRPTPHSAVSFILRVHQKSAMPWICAVRVCRMLTGKENSASGLTEE